MTTALRIGKDPVASDYVGAVKRGGQRRLREAVNAELERHRQEEEAKKQERKLFQLVAESDTIAECTCGWFYVGSNGFVVARNAQTHAILHGNVTVQGVNRIGAVALKGAS